MEKYILNCKVVEDGFVFSSDCSGIMLRFIAQCSSECLEFDVNRDNSVFVYSSDTSQEAAQSFIDDWFNPSCVVLNYFSLND